MKLCALMFCGLLIATSATAQNTGAQQDLVRTSQDESDHQVEGLVTGRFGQSSIANLSGMLTFGVQYESAPEGMAFYAGFDHASKSIEGVSLSDRILRFGGKIDLGTSSTRPYAQAGIGLHELSISSEDESQSFSRSGLEVGGGVRRALDNGLIVNGELLIRDLDGTSMSSILAGAAYKL